MAKQDEGYGGEGYEVGEDVADEENPLDGAETAADVQKRWFIPVNEFLTEDDVPLEIDYIVDQVLETGGVTYVVGMPETAKSFVVKLMALCSALGRPFWGRKTKRVKWVIMDLEMNRPKMAVRLRGLLQGLGVTEDTDEWEMLSSVEVPDYVNMPKDGLVNLEEGSLEVWAQRLGDCGVLVVDSFTKVIGDEDEKEAQVINALNKNLRLIREATGCAVIIIHHPRKAKEIEDLTIVRGSSAIAGEPDVVLYLKRDERGRRLAKHLKLRSDSEEKKWMNELFTIETTEGEGIVIEAPNLMRAAESVKEEPAEEVVVEEEGDPLEEVKADIVAWLSDHASGWVNTRAIFGAVNRQKQKIIRALPELVSEGEIQYREEGQSKLYRCDPF